MHTRSVQFAVMVAALICTPLAQAAGSVTAGQEKSNQCASCHGVDGQSTQPKMKLAGIAPDAFAKAIADFKSGARKNMMMEMFAKKLSDQDVADLGAFFASK